MAKKLTEEQIKDLIKHERNQAAHSYKDEVDLMFDLVTGMYEKKEINDDTFKILTSAILINTTENTIKDLRSNLIKNNLGLFESKDSNKIFFLNYSRKSYA